MHEQKPNHSLVEKGNSERQSLLEAWAYTFILPYQTRQAPSSSPMRERSSDPQAARSIQHLPTASRLRNYLQAVKPYPSGNNPTISSDLFVRPCAKLEGILKENLGYPQGYLLGVPRRTFRTPSVSQLAQNTCPELAHALYFFTAFMTSVTEW